MTTLNYLLLAVTSPRQSAKLYTEILGAQPVQNSETFVLYVLPSGLKIGLWVKEEMEPMTGKPDGLDISFSEPDKAAVSATYAAWKAFGLTILQEPVDMDFGFTFTAADPDGHRLRVFTLADNPR
ncbi:MAG: VOC family protein [Devosia sp.]|nr:VOC family protein [Devosia sp.]